MNFSLVISNYYGVLITVNNHQLVVKKQHKELRCQYLEELSYTFNFDMKDVEENIAGFYLGPTISKHMLSRETIEQLTR